MGAVHPHVPRAQKSKELSDAGTLERIQNVTSHHGIASTVAVAGPGSGQSTGYSLNLGTEGPQKMAKKEITEKHEENKSKNK